MLGGKTGAVFVATGWNLDGGSAEVGAELSGRGAGIVGFGGTTCGVVLGTGELGGVGFGSTVSGMAEIVL
ncbi:MAG: hypothetical protein GW947_03300 [Candidatus Pacebacteria bacterium]|nr:hypothetical protein [Candidatus Paceibacterota bacterium]